MLDLISKRPRCILGLLDESSQTNSTDGAFVRGMHDTFTKPEFKGHGYIQPKKDADRTFVVSHYAGEVVYTAEVAYHALSCPLPPSPRYALIYRPIHTSLALRRGSLRRTRTS